MPRICIYYRMSGSDLRTSDHGRQLDKKRSCALLRPSDHFYPSIASRNGGWFKDGGSAEKGLKTVCA